MGVAPRWTQWRNAKLLYVTTLSYSFVKYSPSVPWLHSWETGHENFDLFLLLLPYNSSFTSSITQKVYTIYKRSAYQTNALLLEIFLILVRATCKLKSTSYVPNTHRSGFPVRHFVHNHTNNSISKGGIIPLTYLTIAVVSDLFSWFEC